MDELLHGPSEEAVADRYGCSQKITIKLDRIDLDKLESGSKPGRFKFNAKDFANDHMTRSKKPTQITDLEVVSPTLRLKRIEDGMVLIHRATYNANPAKAVMSSSLSCLNKKTDPTSVESYVPKVSSPTNSAETEDTDKNNKCTTKTTLTDIETNEGEKNNSAIAKSESNIKKNNMRAQSSKVKEKKLCKAKDVKFGGKREEKEIMKTTSGESDILISKQVIKYKIAPKKGKLKENLSPPQKNMKVPPEAANSRKILLKKKLSTENRGPLKRKNIDNDGKRLTSKKGLPNRNIKSVEVKNKNLLARQTRSLRIIHRKEKGVIVRNVSKPPDNKAGYIKIKKLTNFSLKKNLMRTRTEDVRKTRNVTSGKQSKMKVVNKKVPNIKKAIENEEKKTRKISLKEKEKSYEMKIVQKKKSSDVVESKKNIFKEITTNEIVRKRKPNEIEENENIIIKKMKTVESGKKKEAKIKEDTMKSEEKDIRTKLKGVSNQSYLDVENAVEKLLNGSADCLQNNLAELYLQIEPSRFPSALWKTETILPDLVNGKKVIPAAAKPGPLRRKLSKDPTSLDGNAVNKPKLDSLSEVVVKRCTAAKSTSHDRIVCVKDNLHFYVKIENDNVSLLGAPQVISNIEDLYVLIQIVDEITIDSFNIEK